MLSFLCKKLLAQVRRSRDPTTHLYFLQSSYLRFISTTSTNETSLTVSYLINSCGLSPEAALSASKKIRLKTTTKPDAVLSCLKNSGFTKTQITNLITKLPSVLLFNRDKILDPKLQFFKQIGFSGPETAKLLCSSPDILKRNLKRVIIPSFDFLKSLLHTNKNVVHAITRSISCILKYNLQEVTVPKIQILRDIGVPMLNIPKLILLEPRTLTLKDKRFQEMLKEVYDMGFNPSTMMFAQALRMVSSVNKTRREEKSRIYRSFGWSEDDILSAIKTQPLCMSLSEKKLISGLDFFMSQLNWGPSVLAKCPMLLGHSLEKRIIPRWTVIKVLISKGLIKGINNRVFRIDDVKFFENFVTKYVNEVPELLKVYQGPAVE